MSLLAGVAWGGVKVMYCLKELDEDLYHAPYVLVNLFVILSI